MCCRHPGPPARPSRAGRLLLNDIKVLVLDEADRMLDMGFMPDIAASAAGAASARRCSSRPPCRRKSGASSTSSSATPSASRWTAGSTAATKQLLAKPGPERPRRAKLRRDPRVRRRENAVIVFTRKGPRRLRRALLRHGFSVQALHGDLEQPARTAAPRNSAGRSHDPGRHRPGRPRPRIPEVTHVSISTCPSTPTTTCTDRPHRPRRP